MLKKYSFFNIDVDPKVEEMKSLKAEDKNGAPGTDITNAVAKFKDRSEPEKITSIKALNLEKK